MSGDIAPDEIIDYVTREFRKSMREAYDHKAAKKLDMDVEELDEYQSWLIEKAYSYLAKSDYDGLNDLAERVEDELKIDVSSVKNFVSHFNDEELIDGKEDKGPSDELSGGVLTAIRAKVSSKEMPDEAIFTVNESVEKEKLTKLSEKIYEENKKMIYFISNQYEWDGRISVCLSEYRQKFQLMQVFINKEGQLFYKHFGEGLPNKGYNKVDTHSQSFYVYKFVSNDKQYLMLSRERFDPMRCKVKGMLCKINDAKQVGDQARLPTNQDIIFVNKVEPAIKTMSKKELFKMAKREGIDHEWFANRMLNAYRHPKWFEKLLIAVNLSKHNFGYPSHVIWLGPAGTGKSKVLSSLGRAFGEQKTVFSGTRSTIKGLTPSFKDSPPSEGYLLKTQRVAAVDEIFNLLDNVENKKDLFRNLLDLLEHETRSFESGNGSIRGKMESVMVAAGNPAYGFDTIVEAAQQLDPAFLSRNILYDMTEQHINFIDHREPIVKKKKAKGEQLYPDMSEKLISVTDTLADEISVSLDYDRLAKIKKELKPLVPSGKDIQTVFRSRTMHHLENITAGLAKYHTIIDGRDDFEVRDKDYEECKKIYEMIVSSWRDGVAMDNLSKLAKIEYLKVKTRKVYDIINKEREIKEEDLKENFDAPITYEIGKLKDYGLIKEITIDEDEVLAPYWHDEENYKSKHL